MEDAEHTFYLWAVKQISGHCGVYKRRHMFKEISSPICPIYNSATETARHQMVCQDNDRIEIWNNSVKKLRKWLIQQETREEITHLLLTYIAGRGGKQLVGYCLTKSSIILHKQWIGLDGTTSWKVKYQRKS